ncbi:aldo/keto reductase [Kaistia algarum]|uniref:aldo/keto reductase n=1 Tax=Kaistia algarum TaxID=2083279 RepID=UPI000CE78818|nr:aldo/keto reductase [Kaistia algarum]MCX5515056.1 aldo/keto reductase [Kaistia algarum]PPE79790.1 aldo/keto reductase [Kaistia algarum]
METFDLAPEYTISRVIRGGWQLAGGHGAIDRDSAIADMTAFAEAGIVTFDCADIYTGVEAMIGDFRAGFGRTHGKAALERIHVHTKCVPDLAILNRVTKADIAAIIDQSLQRLRMERLDLVQFHWWDYDAPAYVAVAVWLDELRREGKISYVSGTNFDVPRVREFLAAGVPLRTLQVQYSVLDHRPENGLVELCAANGIDLLCYGSVAGGFLGERWLGVAEPKGELENRSLTKYKLIIDDFGGWALFQELLAALASVAARHGVDIATVASRHVLDRAGVAAVIVGARNRSHLARNLAIGALHLTDEDRAAIDAVIAKRQGPEGDVYTLERDRTGRHGSIMKYNLNAAS